MNITIENISDDKLTREIWEFYFSDSLCGTCSFLLSFYAYQTRKNTRRKWNRQLLYDSHRPHNNDVQRKDILSDKIIQRAKEAILKKIEEEIKFKE